MRPAVFLDRDGTLLEEGNYVDRLDRLVFFPYSIDAVRALNHAGFPVVVVTNQSGVARGMYTEAFVQESHAYLEQQLTAAGARVDGFYYCPHHPQGSLKPYRRDCGCRKPKPGQFLQAAADLHLDLTRSFVVGDRWKDVEAGEAAGARGILVRTGYGRDAESARPPRRAEVVDNLIQAVTWILRQR